MNVEKKLRTGTIVDRGTGTEQPFDLKGDVQSEQMTAMREIMTFTRSR
jgi:hypothetical protein